MVVIEDWHPLSKAVVAVVDPWLTAWAKSYGRPFETGCLYQRSVRSRFEVFSEIPTKIVGNY